MLKRLISPGLSWLVVLVDKSWKTLGRGLGSGTVQTVGAIKHLFVRLASLISHSRLARGLFGVPFNNWSKPPPPLGFTRTTMTDIACGLTSQEHLQYSGRPYPACVPEDETETAVIAYAATAETT